MDFGQLLSDFAATAGQTYGLVQSNKQPTITATAAAPASNAWQSWLPIGIGAAVLLVIVALVFRK